MLTLQLSDSFIVAFPFLLHLYLRHDSNLPNILLYTTMPDFYVFYNSNFMDALESCIAPKATSALQPSCIGSTFSLNLDE